MQEKEESMFTSVAETPFDERHYGAINPPIYQNSLFAFKTHQEFDLAMKDTMKNHVYSRGNNPTVEYLEKKIAMLESGDVSKCFASGMAAISSTIMSVVNHGDHVVCVSQAYGPTREFLSEFLFRFGVSTTFVDGKSMEELKSATRINTKLLYLESPTSLLFELQDLSACAALAKSIGAVTIIDNTWATPCHQKPLTLGIDLVVHSITKYFSGHSDCMGGVVVGSDKLVSKIIFKEYMLLGGIMTPQVATTVTRGLRTLPLRMERHEKSALIVAEHLTKQAYVTRVNHPGLNQHPQHELALRQMTGFSSLFSFDSDEPIEKLKQFASSLNYFRIGVSWGGYESLISVNQIDLQQTGQYRNVVRIYVGLEDPADLIDDIDNAWRQVSLF
ncbi:cystathionine beta-lyase [Paenibacillus catalpae]|uniref:homocysteine desulfhydrase n=1 Tax=Paenibacillus catalpae TaxID=1045775 RepID=A0A1I2BTN0_9BACL|nr:aminotransferase class I/II-fold pyridoxal phosphate-dependent enzyme [Paenibacillus catalpae]SFE59486.1 cystathionine beta-lyase [Paenibacillus catalpae]